MMSMDERKKVSELAEPDSDEALREVARRVGDIWLNFGISEDATNRNVVLILRQFAHAVREHERLALRERPTQPDLKVLLDNGHDGPCDKHPAYGSKKGKP
jgi:hypothetical protein